MPGGEGKTKISFTKEVQVHNCFKCYVCEDYQKNWCKKWILIDLAGLTRKRERGKESSSICGVYSLGLTMVKTQ